MQSKYFEMKTKTDEFEKHLNCLMDEIKGKKTIIYGAGEGFLTLNSKYSFTTALNITGISDKKFENSAEETFEGIRTIDPRELHKEDFDIILVTNERAKVIAEFLEFRLGIEGEKIRTIFTEEISDEQVNYNFVYKFKFEETLPKLVKKLRNKTVVLYGAGAFLELIKKYFDLTGINIIGVADRRFANHEENEEFLGYKAYSPSEIADVKPDCVLVATKWYMSIIEELCFKTLKGTKIKVLPLVRKPLWTLIKEIWE